MKSLQIYEYKGTQIEFEIINGQVFANATEMCQVFGKTPYEFLRSEKAKRYIDALRKNSEVQFIEIRNGGFSPGTWIHEKLILKLAQWLDVEFEIWCDEKMAELIRTGSVSITPLSSAEMFLQNAQLMVEHEKRIKIVESRQDKTEDRITEIEAKISTSPSYFTVVGYAVLNKLNLTMSKAKELGKMATNKCKELGLEIEKVKDARFGFVNSYPTIVLREVFSQAA